MGENETSEINESAALPLHFFESIINIIRIESKTFPGGTYG